MKPRNTISCYFEMLKKVCRISPKYVVLSLSMSCASSIVSVVNIFLIRMIINNISNHNSFYQTATLLTLMAAIPLTLSLIKITVSTLIIPQYTTKISLVINTEIFDKVSKVEIAIMNDPNFYNTYTIALKQGYTQAISVVATLSSLFASIVSGITLAVLLSTTEIWLGMLALTSAAISFVANIFISKISLAYFEKEIPLDRDVAYFQRVFYLQDYAKEIRVFDISKMLLSKYRNAVSSLLGVQIEKGTHIQRVQSLSTVATDMLSLITLLLIALQTTVKQLTIGDFVALQNSTQQLRNNILSISNTFKNVYEQSLYIEKYMEFMNCELQNNPKTSLLKFPQNVDIFFQNVSYCYPGNEFPAVSNLTIQIPAGQTVAFVGENGAGKSTTASLLLRLYEPNEGKIIIGDHDYMEYSLDEYYENISVVFQEYRSFALTIAENVVMQPCPPGSELEQVVLDALNYCGLYERVAVLPNGIHSVLTREFSDDGVMLSGGELQKLALARAYAKRSKLLILDEPTSALDPLSEREFLERLCLLPHNPTVIIISHRLTSLYLTDRIFVFNHGRLLENGSFPKLMASDSKFKEMYLLQCQESSNSGGN